MGISLCWRDDIDQWKKRQAQNYYWRFYSTQTGKKISGKKEYIYTALFNEGDLADDVDRTVKSNQKKLMMDNLMSGRQMEYVMAFDLKSYDEVYRYRTYMRKNSPDIHKPLNVYYLDYLYRNKIRLRDFYDYVDQCRLLGRKLDKPKDFAERHWQMSEVVTQMKNREQEKQVKERYAKLLKNAYSDGDILITPFVDGKEIRECAKLLHNCIASVYLSRYAQNETDLYCLKSKGVIKVAIEVNHRKLKQARIDWNRECPPELMDHIRKWCSINKFEVISK